MSWLLAWLHMQLEGLGCYGYQPHDSSDDYQTTRSMIDLAKTCYTKTTHSENQLKSFHKSLLRPHVMMIK